jgi:hypothetical protein
VTVPAGCKVGDDGIDFTVSATRESAAPVKFVVTAAPKPDASKPDWDALFMGLGADTRPPNKPLKYLEAAWSFKDSWVSNITVLGGLLAGIFGSSDVVKVFLGDDAESAVAVATLGGAFAVAFIGAGPVILFATKSKNGDFFTVGGLLIASAVTLAGAYGQTWVLYESSRDLDLGGLEDWVWIMALAAGALLAIYGARTLMATIRHGINKPKPTPASDTIVGAKMIVEALKQLPEIDAETLDEAVDAITEAYPTIGTSPGDDYPRPKRSALL